MRALAPGKVNLTLFVGRPRADGYHPLVSVVQPLSLADELTLEPAPGDADEVVCAGVDGENLALRALRAYRDATGWRAPPQRLTIVKRIPVAAGMGGGSADAAAALRLVAALAQRPQDPILDDLAPALGADVPALLAGRRVLMTGIGEHVEPLRGTLEAGLVIVPSEHGLSTPDVYREFDRLGLGRRPEELDELARDIRATGGGPPENDLEPAALSLLPEIGRTLDAVRDAGARHALVSGSGPTVFGLFATPDAAREAAARLGGIAAEPVGPAFSAPR